MKFATTLNDAVINVEYDDLEANGDDGLVYECEVTYNGQIVNDLVSGADYAALLMECEANYREHCAAEKFDSAMFKAECAAVQIGRAA